MLSAIVGGVPLRSVPKEVLEERRRQKEKPTDVASEMATRLQGKKEIAVSLLMWIPCSCNASTDSVKKLQLFSCLVRFCSAPELDACVGVRISPSAK